MGANGDRSASRRSKRRGGRPLTPTEAGEMLRGARASLGIELPEVHDRTGISWRNLEALESGDVQRFSDPAAAAVAMRRYAELVLLDPDPLVTSVTSPVFAFAGAPNPAGNGSWTAAPAEADASGHLRRYHDDHSHLRSFTQTAQVPAVGGRSGVATGAFHRSHTTGQHQVPKRRKAPWALRFFIWFVLFLVLVGVAGLSINHYQPQWLRDIHVLKTTPKQASSAGSNNHTTSPPASRPTQTSNVATVKTTKLGIGTATVTVDATNYTVVVGTFNSCWVEAQVPGSVNPLLNRTLSPGQSVSIPVTGGQLSLELGALAAEISVQIDGKTVPRWTLNPTQSPS